MFALDLRSREPIYEQLVEKIKNLIITGVLQADEKLPAVRELSSQLTLNPNTVQKAYRELELRGYIYSLSGRGNFVKPAVTTDHSARLRMLESQLRNTVAEMLYLGMSPEEIKACLQTSTAKNKGGNGND